MNLLLSIYPDEDYFWMKGPPPLDFPDKEDTDDSDTIKVFLI